MQAEQSVREGRLRNSGRVAGCRCARTRQRQISYLPVSVAGGAGAMGRASNQLNVLEEMDPESLPMVQTYREALRCELLRAPRCSPAAVRR